LKILKWGITWNQIEACILATLGIIGKALILMVSTGFFLLNLQIAKVPTWPEAIAALFAVHPVTKVDGEDDHIAVILNAKLCHHSCCAETNDKGMQFADGFVEAVEDVLFVFQDL
jgi:hypothetical protein